MRVSSSLRNVGRVAPSAAVVERVRRPAYLSKVAKAEDLVPLFKNGDYIGWSGFTGVGYPKTLPTAIADDIEFNNLQSDPATKKKFNLFVGASVGPEVEDRWAALDMIARRYPHQVGKETSKGINAGRIEFADKHLSMFPQDLTYGFYSLHKKHGDPSKPLDWAIVEATAITEEGYIVPGASVGASPEILQSAEKIIIEVNTRIPSLEGLHDINHSWIPPHRQPYLITHPSDRIGLTAIPIDPDRVVAVVEGNKPDNTGENAPENAESRAIAKHLIEFLSGEVDAGRLPRSLLPLQSGIGNVANSIIGGLAAGPFDNVQVWTEVLQDTFLQFFDSGKLDFATATSIKFSPDGFDHFYKNWANYKDRLLLRSQQVANSPELIRRLGVIAMNTPLEVDIYAHANSTNALGSRMLNGLGGSADFLRNAKISIMHTPSTRPTKNDPTGISCIVPFASHIDQTEHDLDVIVTEQGLADVRGLSPRERAPIIIEKCAHPDYKDLLHEYYDRSLHECLKRGAGHEPHMLRNAFKFHTNFMEHGTMKIKGWD
ncbi:acyl-CoA carboxylate CoA-transferase [Lentinula guzmanii]|uniref:Acetyl-CoA hydrolase n=2 Tax=Lentinula TaxID=5352 RepID=A0AA38JLZ5_9AGAR|nr:acyl-CoA carboxylate CoA-transferase [Lentinula guzmanii]KAJ3783893.1 acyl-CoA carboxylate CoA-transferase [Lentinula aff. detonsa]KAJ3793104.1 acyl-CoA carboxylate CoA-transferase [Lentinula aff. detonsa]